MKRPLSASSKRPTKHLANSRVLAVLGYHKLGRPAPGGWETWYYVPCSTFVRHLAILEDFGFRLIDAATLVQALDGLAELPPRAALITFDDGYRSVHETLMPLLNHFHLPAVLFVPTQFVAEYNAFDAGTEPRESLCNWDELRELDRRGVSIQSHGVSHRSFSELPSSERTKELRESKRVLEERLERPVTLFAFPYGATGVNPKEVFQEVEQAGYRAAFEYDGKLNDWPPRQAFSLSRLTIGSDTNLKRLLAGIMEKTKS